MKNKMCLHIESALKLSLLAGVSVKDNTEGWTNARKVFHMSNKLTTELRQKIELRSADDYELSPNRPSY